MSFAGAKWVWMNGAFLLWKDANIHVSTHALHYGSGVFEGIRCYDTADGPALFRIAEHLERFMYSARTHSLAIPFAPEQIESAIVELICQNGFRSCYVRPLCYRGSRELTVCDMAKEGETFRGMRAEVLCRKDEIILRDSEGIIATLFQGPDRRTRLTKDTKDIVFFVFSVPGISVADVREGVETICNLFKAACTEIHLHVHESQLRETPSLIAKEP